DLAAATVLDEVRRRLGGDERHAPRPALAEAELLRHRRRGPPRVRGLRRIDHAHHHRLDQLVHRVIVTRVPSPGRESIANSFESRRAPPSPSPSPLPVVKPSFSARSMSAIPGPWSSTVSRSPGRLPPRSAAMRATPPPP